MENRSDTKAGYGGKKQLIKAKMKINPDKML